jgi:hypothetical protein
MFLQVPVQVVAKVSVQVLTQAPGGVAEAASIVRFKWVTHRGLRSLSCRRQRC